VLSIDDVAEELEPAEQAQRYGVKTAKADGIRLAPGRS